MKKILLLILSVVVYWACSDKNDDELSLYEGEEFQYVLPQGNHDYDTRIVKWHERIGKYLLYKFKPTDVYFNGNNEWYEYHSDTLLLNIWHALGDEVYLENDSIVISGNPYPLDEKIYTSDGLWNIYTLRDNGYILQQYQRVRKYGIFTVEEADEDYVGKQLTLLEEVFLNHYSDSLLCKWLPLRIILGKNLLFSGISQYPIIEGYNNLLVNYGDASIDNLTNTEKHRLKTQINSIFCKTKAFDEFDFEPFWSMADYYWAGGSSSSRPSTAQCYALGFVTRPGLNTVLNTIKNDDLSEYVDMIIENSYEKLTTEPANGKYNASDYTGILHTKKDINGLIRRKYDYIIEEYKRHGIDLQAIGDLYN